MRKLNIQTLTQAGHASIDSIKEVVLIKIILRIEPFFLQLPPHRFSNIQMGRIWWEKENVQSSFLPIGNAFLNGFCLVYTGIIQHHNRFLAYLKRKIFHIFQYKLSINIAFGNFPPATALPVYKAKAVELICFFRKDADFFIRKLPTVRDISFAAYMGLISIIQVNLSLSTDLLKFLNLLYLKTVMFLKRLSFGTPSYPFISSAKLFKKALKVLSLTLLPLFASHSAFAVRIRCRLVFMASRILSLSSSRLRTDLRPRPDLVYKPDIPSDLYRLSQLLTLIWHMPVIEPTSFEVRPSDFSKTLWQRIRKLWLLPSFNPASNSLRCHEVRIGVFTRPIMGYKDNNIN
jgi:hypothetical protein